MEAVKEMKKGKKVRNDKCAWDDSYYFKKDESIFFYSGRTKKEEKPEFYLLDFEAKWKIYKEEDNWNLADKRFFPSGTNGACEIEAIKTFIKKVKEDVENTGMICPNCKTIDKPKCVEVIGIKEIIDKRAGDL